VGRIDRQARFCLCFDPSAENIAAWKNNACATPLSLSEAQTAMQMAQFSIAANPALSAIEQKAFRLSANSKAAGKQRPAE
jgi:hypothetical protein